MNRLLTLLFAASCLTAVGQVPDYVPQEDLIGWYPLAGDALDQSPNANSGFFEGPTTTVDRFGNPGGARYFDGESDHFQVSGASISTSFSALNPVTVSLWVFGSEGSQDNLGRSLVGKGLSPDMVYDTNPKSFMLFKENAQDFSFIVYSDHHDWVRMQVQMSDLILQDDWNHLIFRYHGGNDPNSLSIFRNGESISACCSTINSGNYAGMNLNDEPFILGSRIDEEGNHFLEWEGALDDLGIWSRDLSDGEALELYLSSAPNAGCIDFEACNFDSDATIDDGSCHFNCQFCHNGTVWDEDLFKCVVANPADINFDGCVQLNDLLDLLSAYGDCGAEESPWQCGDPLEYQGYDYATVQIGEQCWFAENLLSENYENGDAIPANLNSSAWFNTSSGAVAVYNLDTSLIATYGRLYNGYAVDDARGLCPTGWHVPTDGEWTELTDNLGGEYAAGGQMKTTYGWYNGINGTNSSGFSGLPGGSRNGNGPFYYGGEYGYWWSSSPSGSFAWARYLRFDYEGVSRSSDSPQGGFSVRCIKDTE